MSNSNQYTARRLNDDDGNVILGKNESACRVKIHKENREVVKVKEDNWTDVAHTRYNELFPEGVDIGTPDRELAWIASMEKQLAARKKAAKKAKKDQEKLKREAAEARKRAAFDEALSVHNEKISAADKALAEMTAKRDALVKEREVFLTAHSEFKVKKTIKRKSPGRQHAKWGQDSLTWIRSRIKEADGKVRPVDEYAQFMLAFPKSPRSKQAVTAKISKEKQIWLRRDSNEIAKSVGCFTQTWNQLFKKW